MNHRTKLVLSTTPLIALFASACLTEQPNGTDPIYDGIEQSALVSECGGFVVKPTNISPGPERIGAGGSSAGSDYCDAELLRWSYQPDIERLSLTNTRIELNCCGLHAMTITQQGDEYVITETDAPEVNHGPVGRCACTCVFDFALEAFGIAEGPLPIKLVRHVTDKGTGPQTVFEGTLDLSAGSGVELISSEPAYWCEKP